MEWRQILLLNGLSILIFYPCIYFGEFDLLNWINAYTYITSWPNSMRVGIKKKNIMKLCCFKSDPFIYWFDIDTITAIVVRNIQVDKEVSHTKGK